MEPMTGDIQSVTGALETPDRQHPTTFRTIPPGPLKGVAALSPVTFMALPQWSRHQRIRCS